MRELVTGVISLNVVLLLVGYSVLSPFLKGHRAATWTTYAGVALLVGAALTGLVLSVLVVAGAPASLPVFGVVSSGLVVTGLGVGMLRSRSIAIESPPARGASPIERAIGALAAGGLAAVCGVVLVAGFRASPWLDDAWTFWLPKGVLLTHSGLDERVFVTNTDYEPFANRHYPLWWSIIGGLDVGAVGRIDVRALNGQLALLYTAFVAAATRLLWGHVRRAILLPATLMAAAAPELVAQTESGGADLPLAFFLSLALVASALWLQRRQPLHLALAVLFVAAALNTKDEATALVVVLLLVGASFSTGYAWRVRAWLAGGVVAAFATLAPWLAWTGANGVDSEAVGAGIFDPVHLWDQRGRLWPAAREVTAELVEFRSWFLAVPLLVILSVALAIRERRFGWLGPTAMIVAGWGLLVWVYWAGSTELTFWLSTSAYRVVDPLVLAAALGVPLLAERLVTPSSPLRLARGSRRAAGA